MSEKKLIVVRYQTTLEAESFFKAVDKAKSYDGLELFEVKEIYLKGDIDE